MTGLARHARSRPSRHVLPADVFAAAVERESRRADRFSLPATLVTVRIEKASGTPPARERWQLASEVVRLHYGDDAALGWLVPGATLGVIVPGAVCAPADVVTAALKSVFGEQDRHAVVVRTCGIPPQYAREAAAAAPDSRGNAAPRGGSYTLKRALDVGSSACLLLLMAPVMLVVALAIKLTSRGPVLFRQVRIGQWGRPFTMLKFRTMRVDADPALHHEYVTAFIRAAARDAGAGHQVMTKLRNDPRITPIGAFLRKSSLDELPQLWNVLRGDMSLVGPRPPLPYEVEAYQPWHWRRVFDAKPGLTGLWQVVGRSRTTFDEMVRLDIRYARQCSLWTDLKILLATPRAVLTGKGAG